MDSRDEAIVDAMAKAIHAQVCRRNPFMGKKTWDQVPDGIRKHFREEARAAFEVVTEMSIL